MRYTLHDSLHHAGATSDDHSCPVSNAQEARFLAKAQKVGFKPPTAHFSLQLDGLRFLLPAAAGPAASSYPSPGTSFASLPASLHTATSSLPVLEVLVGPITLASDPDAHLQANSLAGTTLRQLAHRLNNEPALTGVGLRNSLRRHVHAGRLWTAWPPGRSPASGQNLPGMPGTESAWRRASSADRSQHRSGRSYQAEEGSTDPQPLMPEDLAAARSRRSLSVQRSRHPEYAPSSSTGGSTRQFSAGSGSPAAGRHSRSSRRHTSDDPHIVVPSSAGMWDSPLPEAGPLPGPASPWHAASQGGGPRPRRSTSPGQDGRGVVEDRQEVSALLDCLETGLLYQQMDLAISSCQVSLCRKSDHRGMQPAGSADVTSPFAGASRVLPQPLAAPQLLPSGNAQPALQLLSFAVSAGLGLNRMSGDTSAPAARVSVRLTGLTGSLHATQVRLVCSASASLAASELDPEAPPVPRSATIP